MTRSQHPSEDELSLEELALFERLRGEARRERAPAHLAAHILERVETDTRRERLLRDSSRKPRSAELALALTAGAALAAGVAFFVTRPPKASNIAREPLGSEHPAPHSVHPVADPCVSAVVASGTAPLIDDFEDGDDVVAPNELRRGFWRWARETDAPGTAPALLPVPRPAATPSNRLALHVKGGRLSDWGATVEFKFDPACYDASKYVGIAFSAKGPGRIFLAPREVSVIPSSEGGTCERDCHNPHVQKVDLDPRFRSYEVRFDELHQRGIGKPALDARRLNGIAFLVHPEDTPYDVWLDDVRFITR